MNNWVSKPWNNEYRSHANGIINTAFLFEAFFFFLSEINNVQSKPQETQKVSRRNFWPEVFRVVRQLYSLTGFLSNVLLWNRLTFELRTGSPSSNCEVIVCTITVMAEL